MNEGALVKRLRIYLSSTDKTDHKPVYESIVYKARELDIAGATVFRGIMGYGASSEVFSSKLWELTEKVPLVVEIIDEEEKIKTLLLNINSILAKSGKGHIITIEDTEIIIHKKGRNRPEA